MQTVRRPAGLLGRLGSLVPGFGKRRPSDEAERPAAEFYASTLRELREREARERDAPRRSRPGSRPDSSARRGARWAHPSACDTVQLSSMSPCPGTSCSSR